MTSIIRLLLIEDDPADRILLEEVLYRSLPSYPNVPHCSVDWVQSLSDGIALHQRRCYDVIIADLNLYDSWGIETIERMTAAIDNAPIILFTGFVDEQLTLNVARYGIQDYLVKGEFDGALLLRTLRFAIDRYRLERRQRAVARIELVMQQPDELQPLFDYVVASVAELLPTSGGVAIVLDDPERGVLSLGAANRHCHHTGSPEIRAMFKRIVGNGTTEAVTDVTEHPLAEVRALTAYGLWAYISVPIVHEQRCLGVLCVLESSPRSYTQTDIDFMQTLTSRVGLAISRVELYEQLRAQAHDLAIHNAELDAFSYTVAHDLRNLLASVTGYAEMLADDFDLLTPANRSDYLQAIITRGYKMEQVITSLLTLARLRTVDMALEIITMEGVLHEVIHRVHDLTVSTGANVHLLGKWPQVTGNAGWLEEVWVNYVTNALKYGGNPPQVTLGATVVEDFVRFWVKDNGRGIAQDDLPRLFQPFVRLQSTQTDGHGLGLSIVRRIVERCNGRVGVESVVGKGSTFWFELPVYTGTASYSALEDTAVTSPAVTSPAVTVNPIAINAKMKPK
ncbi:response regulator [bacterium]|nr:response regulator [bacterium]